MPNIYVEADIPYLGLAEDIFSPRQKVIPFIGAGASLGDPLASPPVTLPDAAVIERQAVELGLVGEAKRFLEQAIRHAYEIQALDALPVGKAFELAKSEPYPPSAKVLANALATSSNYQALEWPRPLLPVSSYYQFTFDRRKLWDSLQAIFENKSSPTKTHELVARAARWHQNSAPYGEYLIITTNYDRLMELALDQLGVAYCVLTVDRDDYRVDARFSHSMQGWLGLGDQDYRDFVAQNQMRPSPELFSFSSHPKPVVMLFKIHGCLYPERNGSDSIVLSDEDYIDYLSHSGGNGLIPAALLPVMENTGFLFLGYSFRDWNIRGIYKTLVKKRHSRRSVRDYAVSLHCSHYESAFFQHSAIHILETELMTFQDQIRRNVSADRWGA